MQTKSWYSDQTTELIAQRKQHQHDVKHQCKALARAMQDENLDSADYYLRQKRWNMHERDKLLQPLHKSIHDDRKQYMIDIENTVTASLERNDLHKAYSYIKSL